MEDYQTLYKLHSNDQVVCPDCGLLHRRQPIPPRTAAKCSRCGATLYRHRVDPIHRTLALAVTGLIVFVPANVLSVMTFHFNGRAKDNLLITGPDELIDGRLYAVAALVLLTSIVAPLLKFAGLTYVLLPLSLGRAAWKPALAMRVVRFISEWSMLDVYLLAMLVCTVKLGTIGHITASTGLYALLTLILLSIATSLSFDEDAVWLRLGGRA